MSTYTHSMVYLDPYTWTYMQIYKIKYFKHRKLDSVPMRQISYGGRQRLEKCMYNQRKILWQPPRARSKAWSRFSLIVCRRKQLGNLFYLDFRSQGLWTSESSLLQNLSSSAGTMGALGISYTPTIVRIMKEKMVSIAAITSVFFHISISLSTQLSSILCGNEQERAYLPWAWPKPHHALNPPPHRSTHILPTFVLLTLLPLSTQIGVPIPRSPPLSFLVFSHEGIITWSHVLGDSTPRLALCNRL